MATSMFFYSGFAVDMRDMSALFTEQVFKGFGTGSFQYDLSSSTFVCNATQFTVWTGTAPNAKQVTFYGTFKYSAITGDLVLNKSTVTGLQVKSSQDTPLDMSNVRLTMSFVDAETGALDPLPARDVFLAVGNRDLAPLLVDSPVRHVQGDYYNATDDVLIGNGLDNTFAGVGGDDTMKGFGGDDRFAGSYGRNVLTGGAGADTFVFYQPNLGRNTITDFTPGTDHLHFLALAPLGPAGTLTAARFYKSANVDVTGAHDTSDRLLYDTTSGKLYYDPDGTGSKPAVLIAVLGGSPDGLKAADITVA